LSKKKKKKTPRAICIRIGSLGGGWTITACALVELTDHFDKTRPVRENGGSRTELRIFLWLIFFSSLPFFSLVAAWQVCLRHHSDAKRPAPAASLPAKSIFDTETKAPESGQNCSPPDSPSKRALLWADTLVLMKQSGLLQESHLAGNFVDGIHAAGGILRGITVFPTGICARLDACLATPFIRAARANSLAATNHHLQNEVREGRPRRIRSKNGNRFAVRPVRRARRGIKKWRKMMCGNPGRLMWENSARAREMT